MSEEQPAWFICVAGADLFTSGVAYEVHSWEGDDPRLASDDERRCVLMSETQASFKPHDPWAATRPAPKADGLVEELRDVLGRIERSKVEDGTFKLSMEAAARWLKLKGGTILVALKDRDVVLEEAAKVAEEYHNKWSGAGGFEGHTAAARVIGQAMREAFSFLQATGWPEGDFKGALARATVANILRTQEATNG